MPTFADLLASPAFQSAVLASVAARAAAGAADPENDTPNRQRLNRRLLAQPARLQAIASQTLTPVAMDESVRGPWEADGTIDTDAIALVVETQLVALAAGSPVDFLSIERAMTDEPTIRILTAAWVMASHEILKMDPIPAAVRKILIDNGVSYETMRGFAQRFAPFMVAHPLLAPYGGDLSDAPTTDIANAIEDFMSKWATKVAT